MRRRHDWPQRLAEIVDQARAAPFAWGSHDCALGFAVACVQAMTGEDLGVEYRGRYDDALSAARIMREVAGGGIENVATRALGKALDNPLMAQRGDVVMIETERGNALGICLGGTLAFAGERGLGFMEIGSAIRAWRV